VHKAAPRKGLNAGIAKTRNMFADAKAAAKAGGADSIDVDAQPTPEELEAARVSGIEARNAELEAQNQALKEEVDACNVEI
jgi:hypothetical protein